MDINSSQNITNTIANSLSKLNLNSGVKSQKISHTQKEFDSEQIFEEKEEVKKSDEKKITSKIDVDDIKKYAFSMGEDLSIDDINYGLMYGRSVIADYSV